MNLYDYGEYIKWVRENVLNLSQEELARRIDVTSSQISNIEQNRSQPKALQLARILEMANIILLPLGKTKMAQKIQENGEINLQFMGLNHDLYSWDYPVNITVESYGSKINVKNVILIGQIENDEHNKTSGQIPDRLSRKREAIPKSVSDKD